MTQSLSVRHPLVSGVEVFLRYVLLGILLLLPTPTESFLASGGGSGGAATTTPSVFLPSSRTSQTKTFVSPDVEQYRANLEKLMRQQQDLEDYQNNRHIKNRLTSTARHRRMLEIELMKNLEHSDDAINELMHLWMYENDASMAHELEAMQDECSPGMRYEEGRLLEMIRDYPTWAEPRARLALLFFFQGRTRDSYAAALDTLQLKPWHFEIYPLLVLLSLRQRKLGQALAWARRSLPPYRPRGPNKRRTAWIRIAVSLAQDRLAQAEKEESSSSSSDKGNKDIPVSKSRNGLFFRHSDKKNPKKKKNDKKPKKDSNDPEENAWQ